jgi:hypothetical protein
MRADAFIRGNVLAPSREKHTGLETLSSKTATLGKYFLLHYPPIKVAVKVRLVNGALLAVCASLGDGRVVKNLVRRGAQLGETRITSLSTGASSTLWAAALTPWWRATASPLRATTSSAAAKVCVK